MTNVVNCVLLKNFPDSRINEYERHEMKERGKGNGYKRQTDNIPT